MEFLLLCLVVLLLLASNNSELQQIGQGIVAGVAFLVLVVVMSVALVLGFEYFPTMTVWLLWLSAAAAGTLVVRWIYKRFFSAQARLDASYKRMRKRWYRLSAHVVAMEMGRYGTDPADLAWALDEGERILKRCQAEYERYKQLPPEEGCNGYRTEFYPADIIRLDQRLHAAAQKPD